MYDIEDSRHDETQLRVQAHALNKGWRVVNDGTYALELLEEHQAYTNMCSFDTTWFQTIHQQGKFEFNVTCSRPRLQFWMEFFSDLLLACYFCPDMHPLAMNLRSFGFRSLSSVR